MRYFLLLAAALLVSAPNLCSAQTTTAAPTEQTPPPAPTTAVSGAGTYEDPFVAADYTPTNDIGGTTWQYDEYPPQPKRTWHDGFWWYY